MHPCRRMILFHVHKKQNEVPIQTKKLVKNVRKNCTYGYGIKKFWAFQIIA